MISPPAISSIPQGSALAAPQSGDLKAAAQKFEAIFIRQMLTAARAADFGGSDIFSGPGLEQFNAMQDENMAKIASETGAFGFAKVIEAQLAAQTQTQAKSAGGEG